MSGGVHVREGGGEGLIAPLLPDVAVVVETREDLVEVDLFPEEHASLGRAVEKRRREFVTARACARRALARLGTAPVAIASGERGEPLWPAGVVGSITHCKGFRACAVARAQDVASIGIDAEVHDALPDGVLEQVASPREQRRLAAAGAAEHLDRVLFSAKEAVYKAWFPLTGSWLGFEDVDLSLDVSERTFCARLLVEGPVVRGEQMTEFRGHWNVADDIVVATAVTGA